MRTFYETIKPNSGKKRAKIVALVKWESKALGCPGTKDMLKIQPLAKSRYCLVYDNDRRFLRKFDDFVGDAAQDKLLDA
jgi:hypothetical protein